MLNSFFDKFIFTNGLKYRHNNFFLLNIPFLIVPREVLTAIASQKNPELHRVLYSSVKHGVRENLSRQFNLDFGLKGEKSLHLFEQFFTASGWGKISNLNIDPAKKQAVVVVDNSPIAFALEGKVDWEVDHFLRGILAGIFSVYFKADVDTVEHACLATGEERCEFIIKRFKEFDLTKKQSREQLSV